MSDELYYTRLRITGGRGIAKMHGMTVAVTAGPDLGAGPVWACEYTPEIAVAQVQPRSIDPPRDMTRAEIAFADSFLRRITALPEVQR